MTQEKKLAYSLLKTDIKEKLTLDGLKLEKEGIIAGVWLDQSKYTFPNLLYKKDSSANIILS